MTTVSFHDFPGQENSFLKFHDCLFSMHGTLDICCSHMQQILAAIKQSLAEQSYHNVRYYSTTFSGLKDATFHQKHLEKVSDILRCRLSL